jgi:hypothetical protein
VAILKSENRAARRLDEKVMLDLDHADRSSRPGDLAVPL